MSLYVASNLKAFGYSLMTVEFHKRLIVKTLKRRLFCQRNKIADPFRVFFSVLQVLFRLRLGCIESEIFYTCTYLIIII